MIELNWTELNWLTHLLIKYFLTSFCARYYTSTSNYTSARNRAGFCLYRTITNRQIKEVKKKPSSTYVLLVGEGPLWRWRGGWYFKNDNELVCWKWTEEHFKQKRGLDQKPKMEKNWTMSKHEEKTSVSGWGKERAWRAQAKARDVQAFLFMRKTTEFVFKVQLQIHS